MGVHRVDEYEFEFWNGEQPTRISERVQRFERAGTTGVSHRLLGRRGASFTCELTSWHATWADARDAVADFVDLIGVDPIQVVKDGDDLEDKESVRFVVEDVRELSCATRVRLYGGGKNYPGGVELVTRWTMTPVEA